MGLRETIKRILKEQEEFSTKFKRRIPLFKDFVKHCFTFQNPCDYENFAHFMLGIQSEIHEYSSGVYDDDNTNTPDWLTYEEGVDFVETHMIDELNDYYYEMCPKSDLYESIPTTTVSFFNDEEIIQFEKTTDKIMSKYDWWKGITIHNLSYYDRSKTITLYAELNVDEEWGEKQWKKHTFYAHPFPGNKEPILLGEIISQNDGKKIEEELRKLFEFVFSVQLTRFPINQLQLKFITN
jgi:hypothetical protein